MTEKELNELVEERHADYVAEQERENDTVLRDAVAAFVGGGNSAFHNNWHDAARKGYFVGCFTVGDFAREYVKYVGDMLERIAK